MVGRVEEGSPAQDAGFLENDVILAFNNQQVQNRSHFYRLLIESKPGSKVSLAISRGGAPRNVEVVIGQRRLAIMDDRERLFSEVNAMLETAEELHQQAQELLQKGDEKGARDLLAQEKDIRREAERYRADIEKQLREGKIPETSRRPGSGVTINRYQIGVSGIPLSEQLAVFFNVGKGRGGVLVTEVRAGEAGERSGLKAGDCVVSINGEAVKSVSDLNRLVNQNSLGDLAFVIVRDRSENTLKIKLDQK